MYVFEQNTTVHVYSAHFMKPKLGSEEEPPHLGFSSSPEEHFLTVAPKRGIPPPSRQNLHTHAGDWREKSKKRRWILRGKKGDSDLLKGKRKKKRLFPLFC